MTEPGAMEEPPVELVDDIFWLRWASDLVRAGSSLRTDAARQLMSALTWLWTVYTGAAVLGAVVGDRKLSGTTGVILAAPSVTLVIAYAAAVLAYVPVTFEFDPRDPDEIRHVHSEAVRRGWRRLTAALLLTLLSALLLAIAIAMMVTQR